MLENATTFGKYLFYVQTHSRLRIRRSVARSRLIWFHLKIEGKTLRHRVCRWTGIRRGWQPTISALFAAMFSTRPKRLRGSVIHGETFFTSKSKMVFPADGIHITNTERTVFIDSTQHLNCQVLNLKVFIIVGRSFVYSSQGSLSSRRRQKSYLSFRGRWFWRGCVLCAFISLCVYVLCIVHSSINYHKISLTITHTQARARKQTNKQ